MARIRSVHPGLFTDERFVELSMAARIFLIGLWTEADDQGVFVYKPVTLKMRLFPADNVSAEEVLAEVTATGAVVRFQSDGKEYGAIRNFCKWQRPKSPQYIHPCPAEIAEIVLLPKTPEDPDSERGTALGRILCEAQNGKCHYCEADITFYRKRANSLEVEHRIPISRGGTDKMDNLVAACKSCNRLKRNLTDAEFLAKFAKSDLAERSASQVAKDNSHSFAKAKSETLPQREEGIGIGKESPPTPPPGGFDQFWNVYPHKIEEDAARIAFNEAERVESVDVICAGARRYAAGKPKDQPWQKAHLWLKKRRWRDQWGNIPVIGAKPSTSSLCTYDEMKAKQKRQADDGSGPKPISSIAPTVLLEVEGVIS